MHKKPLRFLALGDSYTIGEGVAGDERWPVQLSNALRENGLAVEPPRIIARTGWTTDELADAITQAEIAGPYDLVSLLIGVNNQYRHRSSEEYRIEFHELLHDAIDFAGGDPRRVIVLSIPDWGVTPFAIQHHMEQASAEIDRFNEINRQEAEQAGVWYVDITPISRQAQADPTMLAEDKLHPSGKMYTAWVDRVLPIVLKALR